MYKYIYCTKIPVMKLFTLVARTSKVPNDAKRKIGGALNSVDHSLCVS